MANASSDYYVYGHSKNVKAYIEENLEENWNLQFFPKEAVLLEVVEGIKKEEGKKVIYL
ncbi:MAG: hypothetical protein ACE3JQ_04950 [Paenisporosarcina sp.]